MPFGLTDEEYYDGAALRAEEDRLFTICQDCRLCFKFCASFPALFDGFDAADQTIAGVTEAVRDAVVDHCFQCKLCDVRCPYAPPHEWAVDIPNLLLRRKAQRVRANGVPFVDRMMSDIDRVGKVATRIAPLANFMNTLAPNRHMMERMVGIHHARDLPPFANESFEQWLRKQPPAPAPENPTAKVALFHTCYGNYNGPAIARAAKRVLEYNGCEVVHPAQACCGMPNLDTADLEATRAKIRQSVPALAEVVAQGYSIVVPNPTCGLMIKKEWPALLPDDADVTRISENTHDLCDFLWLLKPSGKLRTDFQSGAGKVAYHAPCHLRKQSIGFPARNLLKLLPDTEVELIQECSAHDGMWSAKQPYFEESLTYGKKLFDRIEKAEPALVVSDCPLASIQINQAIQQRPLHPVQVLARAYGLPED